MRTIGKEGDARWATWSERGCQNLECGEDGEGCFYGPVWFLLASLPDGGAQCLGRVLDEDSARRFVEAKEH